MCYMSGSSSSARNAHADYSLRHHHMELGELSEPPRVRVRVNPNPNPALRSQYLLGWHLKISGALCIPLVIFVGI